MRRRVGRDEEAFTATFERSFADVTRFASRRCARADVDAVVAEVFTVAWRSWDRRPADDEIMPWLYAIARNVVRNQQRAARRRPRGEPLLTTDGPAGVEGDAQRVEAVEALLALGPRDREVLMLHAWEGLSPAELAHVLGTTEVAARVRLHRARRRLLARLDPVPDDLLSDPTFGRNQ